MTEASTTVPAESVASAIQDGKTHLLLGASGSVAIIKLPNIILALKDHRNLSIRVVLTKSAVHFLNGQSQEQPTIAALSALPNVDAVYQDDDELAGTWTRGTGILHINLRKWADILLVVPLSANTLAKIVNGMSDSLLTSVIRAWDTTGLVDGKRKRIIVAPSMNTAMWLHPVTAHQIRVLEEDWGVADPSRSPGNGAADKGWFEVLRPIEVRSRWINLRYLTLPSRILISSRYTEHIARHILTSNIQKALACGDVGAGGMVEWPDIVKVIERRLSLVD
jgi:phosphopantothenoylcysteine decarboxylase